MPVFSSRVKVEPFARLSAPVGMPCAEQDSFKGAACGNAQICSALDVTVAPICYEVCDTACNDLLPDGGMLPRCATEPHAKCTGSLVCHKVTSTTGAIMGFCK